MGIDDVENNRHGTRRLCYFTLYLRLCFSRGHALVIVETPSGVVGNFPTRPDETGNRLNMTSQEMEEQWLRSLEPSIEERMEQMMQRMQQLEEQVRDLRPYLQNRRQNIPQQQ